MIKRIFLFILTNLAIIIVVSAIIFVLERVFNIRITPSLAGGYGGLFMFALVFGFA
jgi:heat shock protein HtpX